MVLPSNDRLRHLSPKALGVRIFVLTILLDHVNAKYSGEVHDGCACWKNMMSTMS